MDRYVVISSDCHAGADLRDYRPYLEAQYHDEFDAWADSYVHPFRDLTNDDANRNWDSSVRMPALEADGVVAEVLYPNTVPPFFPISNLISLTPTAEDFRRRLAGLRAHNRWLADFCAEYPSPPRGHRSDPAERCRRGRPGHPLDRRPWPARRRTSAGHATWQRHRPAPCSRVRPDLARLRGARGPGQRSRRRRHTRPRDASGVARALRPRGQLLLPPAGVVARHVRRLRPVPEHAHGHRRSRARLGAERRRCDGPHPRQAARRQRG